MTSEYDGKTFSELSPKQLLIWWIEERWRILLRKQEGAEKPWSDDPVFQTTYFCNVRREDDKTTKWFREFYSQIDPLDPMMEYNVILSRFLNWPPSIQHVDYQKEHKPALLVFRLTELIMNKRQVWSGAYIITTHGIPMPKVNYLAENVLGGVSNRLEWLRGACRGYGQPLLLSHAHRALMQFEGLGSFLAAQVVADLKNTRGHPLQHAPDWWSFVAPGPGSVRGLEWFHTGKSSSGFQWDFMECRDYVDEHLNHQLVPKFCNQDLQNCLCEFDKYMRVRNGTGRSKRNYEGN